MQSLYAVKPVATVSLLWLLMAAQALPQSAPIEDPATYLVTDYEAARLEKVVTAVRIDEEISVDGFLNEAVWELASPATDFVQRRPNPGRLSAERTEVRFLYDEDNLYVGAILFDSEPDRLGVNDLEQDFNFRGSDVFTIAIDSLHDLRSAYTFRTNPAGAIADAQISQAGQGFNNDWDAVWDVKTSTNGAGWVAEFVIPFKTLRFTTEPVQVWGLNINRGILRINEESDWSPIPIRYNLSRVSQAGTLLGIENISQGRNLKVTPFVTAGVTQIRPEGDPLGPFDTDHDLDGGVDLKYSLTPSVTLDATYRTDFAQVEVDQQQVNLTRFNLFFPEKRDFFLENSSTFAFGAGNNLVPFFSRRIGLSSTGTPIPIVGGARITGQVGRFDLGFLSMKTESHEATPSNNYVVGRVKRNLGTNSWIGGLFTQRESTVDGDYNRVYGADLHFQHSRLEVDSHLLASDTPGLTGKNQARQLEVAWRDDEVVAGVGYNEIQTHFNPEVGFIRRKDNIRYNGDFAWNPLFEDNAVIRNLVFSTRMDYYESGTTEQIETREEEAAFGIRFEDNSSVDLNVIRTFDRLIDPFRIRGNIAIPAGDYDYFGYSARFSTNPGRKLNGNLRVEWGEFWNGRRRSFRGGMSWRPDYHFKMDLDFTRDEVTLPNGDFTTDLVGARFLYAFNPRTFLNAFFQYNASTQQVSSNIRFNLIHHPLSDLFLVYNDLRSTTNGQLIQRAVILKLTNLFNF